MPKNLSDVEKARILALREEGVPTNEIVRRTGRGEATIRRIAAAARGLPPNQIPKRKPGSGAPRKTSKGTDVLMRREVLKNPFFTANDLKRDHPQLLANVSVRTLQHRLQKDLGIPSRRAAKKTLLTPRMAKKRIDFAKRYLHFTEEDWMKVMFSDESTFKCIRSAGGRVRRPKSTSRYNPRYTVATVKHSDQVMVWGCFSGISGRGGLYFLPKNTTMNSDTYIRVLEDHLITTFAIHGTNLFMHDGAPCHTSKKVKAYLSGQNIPILDWPGNSPDLNPIENAWNYIKDKLATTNTSSIPRLEEELKKWWISMDHQYFKKLAASMPKRLRLVLQAKGQMTKY